MQEHAFDAGSTIYREGESSDSVYVAKAEAVKVLCTCDGDLIRLGVLRRSEMFGEDGGVLEHPGSTIIRPLAEFERTHSAPLHVGTNDVVAGSAESPSRFTLVLERATSRESSSEMPSAAASGPPLRARR